VTALRATVRLQLHRAFDFAAAEAHVPYFAALGISHLYLSPIATARPGSTHGYDVIDPLTVNPELGGEEGLNALVRALHAHDMGAILDIVPNHMAADLANVWWNDVLLRGEASRYAGYFDIEWDAPETEGKLWLPWLEQPLSEAIESHALNVERHVGGTGVGICLGGNKLPISEAGLRWLFRQADVALPTPKPAHDVFDSVRQALQDASTRTALDQAVQQINADSERLRRLLDLQHYRLAWWRSGDQVLNYRRFFDIHGLAALRMESDEVFDAVHALPLRLIESGAIDGLRIDHIDGISQPGHYLRRLRERMDQRSQRDLQRHVTLHVEKILAPDESLPPDWPVDGTTGYDFMQQVGNLQLDQVGYAGLGKAWARMVGRSGDFSAEEVPARRHVLHTSLIAELSRCARAFHRFVAGTPARGDMTLDALKYAIADLLQYMPVYRTYMADGPLDDTDRQTLQHAFAHAERDGEAAYLPMRALLQRHLLDTDTGALSPEQAQLLQTARRRFEQLSTVVNAKSVEDTAFYRHGVLLSCNEVGSLPGYRHAEPKRFHALMRIRAARWPRSLLATATHDHKRGEDVRARLMALGEQPRPFVELMRDWCKAIGVSTLPSCRVLWMLLQTILGAWPLQLEDNDATAMQGFAERIKAWVQKAEREAKLHTCWTSPNEAYEAACAKLVDDLLLSTQYAPMRHSLRDAAHRLDAAGALNGLVATTLRLTVPGVPDLYQGTELWDQSLVDPENRRAVVYRRRAEALDQAYEAAALLRDYRNGAIKQQLIHRLLQLRNTWPNLFAKGSYAPVPVAGARRKHVLAFARQHGPHRMLVLVPRLCAGHMNQHDLPLPDTGFWENTRVQATDHDAACTFIDLFTYRKHPIEPSGWSIDQLLREWPVAVLVPMSQADECPRFPSRSSPSRSTTPDQ
jgi:(1->4)-alpha-D-glucan 1-alpha-D-glucosylmutase